MMRCTFKIVAVAAALTTSFTCLTRVDARQASHPASTHEKVYTAEDFRKGAVDRGPSLEAKPLLVEIAPGLPPYRLQFISDKGAAASDAGSSEKVRHVGRIVISRRGSAAIIQTIELESHLPPPDVMKWFDAKDINFDGYLDLAVPFDSGAKWMSFTYWCFDKAKGRFATSALSDELREVRANSIELDPQVDEIDVWHLGSDCPGLHEIFKIVDGHLVLVRDEKYAPEGKGCILSIEKRIEGKMAVVETRAVPAVQKEPH
jgi:hypothetical protein